MQPLYGFGTNRERGGVGGIIFILLIIAVVWHLMFAKSGPGTVPVGAQDNLETLPGVQGDQCDYKERCITVYVTPWCGACRSAKPFIQALGAHFSHSDKVGVQVVIGKDSKEKMIALGEQYGALALLDYDSTFHDKIEVLAYPMWIVWDENKKIKEHFAGAPRGGQSKTLIRAFLDQYLGMENY